VIFQDYIAALTEIETLQRIGKLCDLNGLMVTSDGPAAAIGDLCEIRSSSGHVVRAKVVGFRGDRVLLMPSRRPGDCSPGTGWWHVPGTRAWRSDPQLLGRVLDGFGKPIDGGAAIEVAGSYDLHATPPGPLEREPITLPLVTGVRAIDGLLPLGEGQRIGIFGGSGVGKSTLLGAMARHNSADVSVIALIGERNREVREFIDTPAPLRTRAAFVAFAVAEYFRDQGKSVLLVLDSVTRLATAQREIGLAGGEPPSQKGYTPSVFSLLPQIFERAAALFLRSAMAEYERSEDLINLGAYAAGSNPALDAAIRIRPMLLEFLRQDPKFAEPMDQTLEKLYTLARAETSGNE